MSGMKVSQAVKAARGHWAQILPALGVNILKNRHQPCPVCGGKDRFRFDDQEGRGTWFCNQCGAGDGLALVTRALNVDISEAADRIHGLTHGLSIANSEVRTLTADTDSGKDAAAALAARLLQASCESAGNTYLTHKGFPEHICHELTSAHKIGGVMFRPGDLIVPLYNADGELVNIQLISGNGSKCFLKGGQVKEAYHLIEGGGSSVRRIWIAEGYATALTIHHLTGEAVMVAFSSVNFLSLTSVAHNKYPGYQLIIAADRDLNGSGQERAETAAKACQCDIVLPPVFGDWNDALTQYGEESTRKAILEALKPHNASPF
ncbi:TPA: primase-helicase zinc-binding domain-containing protein, partial [Escherichia coli]